MFLLNRSSISTSDPSVSRRRRRRWRLPSSAFRSSDSYDAEKTENICRFRKLFCRFRICIFESRTRDRVGSVLIEIGLRFVRQIVQSQKIEVWSEKFIKWWITRNTERVFYFLNKKVTSLRNTKEIFWKGKLNLSSFVKKAVHENY